jgi:serine protease AprX
VVPNTSGTLLRDTLGLNNVGVTGRGVTVALIDSGISPVLDLGGRIKAFYDFTRGGIATAPYDDNGHGTHVAGLIGGSGLTSLGLYRGVAPNVSFVGLKVLTAAGGGSTSNLIAAIEFATANKKALGIDVINLSLGHPPYEPAALDPLVQAVQGASRAGILVVSSAGNNGIKNSTGLPAFGGISSPGNAPSSLTVGSERTEGTKRRSDDTAGAWSSRGPSWYDGYAKPDILAPGHKMVGPAAPLSMLVLSNPTLLLSSGRYLALTGTSMSAGVVSGLAALVIEANRTAFPYRRALTPNAIKTIFEYTAFTMRDTSGTAVNRLIQGAGMVNGAGAIRLAGVVNPSATTAATRVTGPVEQHDWIDERLSWAQNVIWGDNVVWGEDLVWGENSVWGENIVWSENLVWGENIVWSENFLDPSGAAAQPSDLELAPGDADLTATSAESF